MGIGELITEGRITELERIPLAEALESIDGFVKVGTFKGTGFVFCGTRDQYKAERDELDEILLKKREKTYENAVASLKECINMPHVDVADYMREALRKVDGDLEAFKPDYDEYIEFVKRRFKAFALRPARITKAKAAIEEFTPADARIVKRAYPATTKYDPLGTMILIIEGSETGDAWTVDEYRNIIAKRARDKALEDMVIPFDSAEYDEVFGNDG